MAGRWRRIARLDRCGGFRLLRLINDGLQQLLAELEPRHLHAVLVGIGMGGGRVELREALVPAGRSWKVVELGESASEEKAMECRGRSWKVVELREALVRCEVPADDVEPDRGRLLLERRRAERLRDVHAEGTARDQQGSEAIRSHLEQSRLRDILV